MEVPVNVLKFSEVYHGATQDCPLHTYLFYIYYLSLDINSVSRLVLAVDNCTKVTAELDVAIL
jgi:hypothetical protein